jgi:hypothetical protein
MIILPTLLKEQLRKAAPEHQKSLAILFARDCIVACTEFLHQRMADVALAYLDSAQAYLAGDTGIGQLAKAHVIFYRSRDNGDKFSRDATWLAALAVNAVCQRDLENAGVIARSKYVPDPLAVAKEAQAVMAQKAVLADGGQHDPARTLWIRRAAKWEEARTQLIKLIETTPIPEGSGEDSRH